MDIYGACGNNTCPRSSPLCHEILNNHYKFYLAFENSNCRDYITEKFFVTGLGLVYTAYLVIIYTGCTRNNILPIVMGARPEDYARVAPHHSYIHVDQFRGPRHLAQYLHMLDKDDDKYNQYFQVRITQASVGSILGNILVERNRRVYQHKILLQSVCLAAPS